MATFLEELLVRLGLDTDEQSFKKGEKGIGNAENLQKSVTYCVT